MIPLLSSQEKLISLKGQETKFYEVQMNDLEGLTLNDLEATFSKMSLELKNIKDITKLYFLKGQLYLNCSEVDHFCGLNLVQVSDPLEVFPKTQEIRFYENYATLGAKFLRVLTLTEFPSRIHPLEIQELGDFILSFRPIERDIAKKSINMRRKIHFSSLFKGMRDIESENAYKDAETILEGITTDQIRLFQAEMMLLIWGESKDDLDSKTQRMQSEIKLKEAKVLMEERGLSYFFAGLIPGVTPTMKRSLEVDSEYLSHLIPLHRDFIHPNGMKLETIQGESIHLDLFHPDNLNFNALITGSAGQGKSMLANKILGSLDLAETKAMILDLGLSFEKNVNYLGGRGLSQKINPMQFKNPRYLKEFILAAMDENLGKKREGELFEKISETLAIKEILSFAELLEKLEESFSGISHYFSEIREFFCEDALELQDLTYCDFGLYPEAIKAPLIIYLIEYYKNLKGKKVFIFDECWHLLEKNANYIAECFRTFRKHHGSAIAISQNIDDFSETHLGRVILQNTFHKFLFRQNIRTSEFLDSHEMELLSSVQSQKGVYSEFLYLSERHRKVLRFHPKALEYELYTSDPVDKRAFNDYLEEEGKYIPFKKAIENFTKIKHLTLFLILFYVTPSFALLGQDTALLVELVTTTASQLNELEKLVTNAEKHTERMQRYNELAQDEYFRAQRVLYLAENMASKREVENLGTLNYAIRDLKYSMSDFEDMMKHYQKVKGDEKKTQDQVLIQKRLNSQKERLASEQVNKSTQAQTSGRAQQLTAQNTALMLESNVELHNTQLEILEKISTTNKLLAEQMEEKRREEILRRESYGIKEIQ
jgi:hypothetical protein